jgi:hypothetical protein
VVALDVPRFGDSTVVRRFVRRHGGAALVGKNLAVDDAVTFHAVAGEVVNRGDWDPVSCSFLTDVFGLAPFCPIAFHIYGLPPIEMAGVEAPLLRRVTAFSAVSSFVRDEFCALFGGLVPKSAVTVILPSLSEPFFGGGGKPMRDIDFACAGRLVPRKGVDVAIRAVAALVSSGEANPALAIAGEGPERPALEALCRDLRVQDAVWFLGELNAEALCRLLDRVRWFVHPARKPEAFGLAGLEAMARGVPCLASTPGGMSEYLRHGCNGWEIAASDPELFAEGMRTVLRQGFPEESFRANARATAAQFSRTEFARAVNAFYLAASET